MDVNEAVTSRRAVRGFTNQPVSKEVLERVLSAAAWAPSGSNLQPWNIYVVTGAPLAELKHRAVERVATADPWDEREYVMYPPELKSPYHERRSAFGKQRYSTLHCARGLIEGLAPGYGDTLCLLEPALDSPEQSRQLQPATVCSPRIGGDASGTADGAALEPDSQPPAGTQRRHGKMHARDGDPHACTSRSSSCVTFPDLIAEMTARPPRFTPLSNSARARGLLAAPRAL